MKVAKKCMKCTHTSINIAKGKCTTIECVDRADKAKQALKKNIEYPSIMKV